MNDRILGLLIGCVIGYLIGRFECEIKGMKGEIRTMASELKKPKRREDGFMQVRILKDICVLVVVILTAWASFVSQKASNDATDSQDRFDHVVACNQQLLKETITALGERSTYTVDVANANIDLQQAQADFTQIILHRPPYSDARKTKAFRNYFHSLNEFLKVARKNKGKVVEHPLPTIESYISCLNQKDTSEGEH